MFKRFSVGFATGYVFGARAGEKRYKQIAELADKALELPVVSSLADRATEVLNADSGRHLLELIRERAAGGLSMPSRSSRSSRRSDPPIDEGEDRDEPDDEEPDGGVEESEDEGDEVRDEGDEVRDESDEVRDEGDEVRDEGDEVRDESDEAREDDDDEPDLEDDDHRWGGIRALASAAMERGRVT